MKNESLLNIAGTVFLTLVISSLPTHQHARANPTNVEVCGFKAARMVNLMLPVLPSDPLTAGKKKDLVVDLLISPEGELTASAPFYAPSKSFLPGVKRALGHSTFAAAVECDEPASGFIRHTVDDYFFVTHPVPEDETVPPEPLWVLDPYLIERLDTITRFSGEESGIRVSFEIDAEGHIADLFGTTKAGMALVTHFFEPLKDRLAFAPAIRAGEPAASNLTLHLSSNTAGTYRPEKQAEATRFAPMPRNPMSEAEGEKTEVAATIDFNLNGEVTSARVGPDTPAGLATAVIAAVRTWSYRPENTEERPNQTSVTCRFGFVPGENEAFLLDQPEEVVLVAPQPTKRVSPTYPFELKKAGVSGRTEVLFIVTTKGKTRDIKIENSTHPDFSQAAMNAVSGWRFKPGRRNGEPVEFVMMLPIQFNLTN